MSGFEDKKTMSTVEFKSVMNDSDKLILTNTFPELTISSKANDISPVRLSKDDVRQLRKQLESWEKMGDFAKGTFTIYCRLKVEADGTQDAVAKVKQHLHYFEVLQIGTEGND